MLAVMYESPPGFKTHLGDVVLTNFGNRHWPLWVVDSTGRDRQKSANRRRRAIQVDAIVQQKSKEDVLV